MRSKTWSEFHQQTARHKTVDGVMAVFLRGVAESFRRARQRRDLAALSDHNLRDIGLSRSDVDGALGRLLGLVRRVSGDDRDAVRERLIEYFDLLGPDDPRVGPARRALANALF